MGLTGGETRTNTPAQRRVLTAWNMSTAEAGTIVSAALAATAAAG